MSTIRALLVAEAANPEWRSVPLIGWSHSEAIAKQVDAHLVTQVRNRVALLNAGLTEGEEFTAIDSEAISAPMWKLTSLARGGAGKGWTTVQAMAPISYYYFEHLIWKQFRDRLKAGEYDVVHRITPMSPTIPSILARRCAKLGVPFVVGPLNGGLAWPPGFRDVIHREREWMSYVRSAHRWLPGYRDTRRKASAILAGSRDTLKSLPEEDQERAFYVPENAVDPRRFEEAAPRPADDGTLRILFVGRLVPYKGADMLLEAADPLLSRGDAEITVVGSGPEEERLRAMCESAGYAERVHFPGSVPHEQLQQFYADANVFAFPSIRELGGAVVLEAMYMGVTPIVIDYGGPPEFVPAGTGVCLPMGRREAIVSDLRTALERAAADPSRLGELGAAARRLVTERHTWDAKAKSVVEIYEWVLGRGPRPDLAPPAEDLRCGFDDRDADVVARSGGAPRAPKPHARAVAARN